MLNITYASTGRGDALPVTDITIGEAGASPSPASIVVASSALVTSDAKQRQSW
jgi:hypothetical protein